MLAADYTVVTHDPLGISGRRLDDPEQDSTPELRADDVAALLDALGAESADMFGTSGGAVEGQPAAWAKFMATSGLDEGDPGAPAAPPVEPTEELIGGLTAYRTSVALADLLGTTRSSFRATTAVSSAIPRSSPRCCGPC